MVTSTEYKPVLPISRSYKPGAEMEARLLSRAWGLVLVFLLQAESTAVELVPEKVPLSS